MRDSGPSNSGASEGVPSPGGRFPSGDPAGATRSLAARSLACTVSMSVERAGPSRGAIAPTSASPCERCAYRGLPSSPSSTFLPGRPSAADCFWASASIIAPRYACIQRGRRAVEAVSRPEVMPSSTQNAERAAAELQRMKACRRHSGNAKSHPMFAVHACWLLVSQLLPCETQASHPPSDHAAMMKQLVETSARTRLGSRPASTVFRSTSASSGRPKRPIAERSSGCVSLSAMAKATTTIRLEAPMMRQTGSPSPASDTYNTRQIATIAAAASCTIAVGTVTTAGPRSEQRMKPAA